MRFKINDVIHRRHENFDTTLMCPWEWCGRQWREITHIKEGSLGYKVAQVALKALSFIPLALAITLAAIPAFISPYFPSFNEYGLLLSLTEEDRKRLQALSIDTSWEFEYNLRQNLENFPKITGKMSFDLAPPFFVKEELCKFGTLVTFDRSALWKSRSHLFTIMKNAFLGKNKDQLPPILKLQDLILRTPLTEQKKVELEGLAHSLKKIKFTFDLKVRYLYLSVFY